MRPAVKYEDLLCYLELRGLLTFREITGRHMIDSFGQTEDGSKKHYVEEFNFPRQTLDRLLKKGLTEGHIKKTEPTEKGKRGRPAYQYSLAPTYPFLS
jgi:hypothetical protein